MDPLLQDAERRLASAGWVRRLALGLAGDVHEAEDLVQDALVVALERREERPAAEGAFGAWFAGVLRHLAWKRRRAEGRRGRREALAARPEAQPGADALHERVSLHQELVDAVMRLDEPYRSALLLRYLDELSPRAIARRLGVPPNTVRTRLQRGRARLRDELDRAHGGRERWLPGLLALGEAPLPVAGTIAGSLGGLWLVGTKTKLALAAVVGVVGLWGGLRLAQRGPETEARVLEAPAVATRALADEPRTAATADAPAAREAVAAQAAEPTPPALATLEVRVLARESGRPLPRVWVDLRLAGAERTDLPLRTAVTGDEGTARFELPPDRALELATRTEAWIAEEARLDVAPLTPGEARTLDVPLATEADARFFGRVLDAATDQPLAGAWVRLDDLVTWDAAAGGFERPGVAEASSGTDGLFELRLCSWRPGVLRIVREGYGMAMVSASAAFGSPLEPRVVSLEREAALEITVVGASEPLRAVVSVPSHHLLNESGPWNYRWLPDPRWEAPVQADQTGGARLAGLPPNVPLALRLLAGEETVHESEPLRLDPGETRRLELVLSAGAGIRGVVVDEAGAPAPGTEVWLVKGAQAETTLFHSYVEPFARTRADERGAFAFAGVEDGEWTVGPASTRAVGAPARPDLVAGLAHAVRIGPGAAPELELVVWRGLYVRGRAVGAGGSEPVGFVTVFASSPGFFGSVLAMSDAKGDFALGPLVPGDYVVQGRASGAGSHTSAAPVRAKAGDEGVVLSFARGGSVSGRLLRGPGREDVGFWIAFQPTDSASWPSSWSSPDPSDPTFRRDGLEPGTYTLIARSEDGEIALTTGVEIEAGQETRGIELVLEPGGRLALSFEAPEGPEGIEHAMIELRRDGLLLVRGAFPPGEVLRELLPAGPLTVRFLDAAGTLLLEEELVLEAGEELRHTARL